MKHLSPQRAALLKRPMKRLWVTAAARIPIRCSALLLRTLFFFFFSCIRFHAADGRTRLPHMQSACGGTGLGWMLGFWNIIAKIHAAAAIPVWLESSHNNKPPSVRLVATALHAGIIVISFEQQ